MEIKIVGDLCPTMFNGLAFLAEVDGQPVEFEITWDALQTASPELTYAPAADQFQADRENFLRIAEDKFRKGGVSDGVCRISSVDL